MVSFEEMLLNCWQVVVPPGATNQLYPSNELTTTPDQLLYDISILKYEQYALSGIYAISLSLIFHLSLALSITSLPNLSWFDRF